MEQRRFKDIMAFKDFQGNPLAFHARNLELAEISDLAWDALIQPDTQNQEARLMLEAWEQETSPDVKSGKLSFGIRSLTINVTQICNLKCTYCAAGGDGTYGNAQVKINVEKTLPQLRFFLEKIPDGGSFNITFLGGEPLLYPEGIQEIGNYVQLMTAGRNIKARFSIVTNGTLISEYALSVLKSLRANITVSLDGPADVNDRTRPAKTGESSTDATVKGLAILLANKSELGEITVHGVFDRNNLEALKAYSFYATLGVDHYEFTFSVEDSDSESNQKFIAEMKAVAAKAYSTGGESALRKIRLFDQYFTALDNQQRKENFCGAGKSFLMLDAQNNLYTCPWDVGNKDEQVGQGTHLDQDKMKAHQAPQNEKNNCKTCWARFLCGGGCMYVHKKATATKDATSEQFCERTRSLIQLTLLYYKLSRSAC